MLYCKKFWPEEIFAVEALPRNFQILREFIFADAAILQILRELFFADTDTGKKGDEQKNSYLKRFAGMIMRQTCGSYKIESIGID